MYEKTGKIPRDVKYTLVEVLKKDLTEIMVMIYRANATTGKLPYIERARDLVVGVKVRLRLLQDMRHISRSNCRLGMIMHGDRTQRVKKKYKQEKI